MDQGDGSLSTNRQSQLKHSWRTLRDPESIKSWVTALKYLEEFSIRSYRGKVPLHTHRIL